MRAGDFARLIQEQFDRCGCVMLDNEVEKISLGSGTVEMPETFKVSYKYGGASLEMVCNRVIIAVGPGPERLITFNNGQAPAALPQVVSGTDFLHQNWAMPKNQTCEGKTIAVYGGSATSAWVVATAIIRKMKVVIWFKRPGEGTVAQQFADAFPPGNRNNRVETQTEELRKVARLIHVQPDAGDSNKITLELEIFNDQRIENKNESVDVLVYALGAAHTVSSGVPAIVCPDLAKQLIPFYDMNMAISKKPALLAIGTSRKELMIVGSSMATRQSGFAMAGHAKYLATQAKLLEQYNKRLEAIAQYKDIDKLLKFADYVDIGESLPPASRPTQGIALIVSAVEALNDFMPKHATGSGQFKWNINFNTFNRTQLAAYFTDELEMDGPAVNLAVAFVIHVRGRPHFPTGLTPLQVQTLVTTAQKYVSGLSNEERARLYADEEIERISRETITPDLLNILKRRPKL